MIQSEDLMIGDWLVHKNGQCYQVTRIQENKFACGHPSLWNYNNEFNPIPLTGSILERNGFIRDDVKTEQEGGGIFVYYKFPSNYNFYIQYNISTGKFKVVDHWFTPFKYLHELQHILKMCCYNKEIIL